MNRRTFHRLTVAGATALALPSVRAQPVLKPTPADSEGPYYPEQWSGDIDADLLIPGGAAMAQGQWMEMIGTVRDTRGQPIAKAQVEI